MPAIISLDVDQVITPQEKLMVMVAVSLQPEVPEIDFEHYSKLMGIKHPKNSKAGLKKAFEKIRVAVTTAEGDVSDDDGVVAKPAIKKKAAPNKVVKSGSTAKSMKTAAPKKAKAPAAKKGSRAKKVTKVTDEDDGDMLEGVADQDVVSTAIPASVETVRKNDVASGVEVDDATAKKGTAGKKAPVKKAPVKKAPVKKEPVKKAPVKKLSAAETAPVKRVLRVKNVIEEDAVEETLKEDVSKPKGRGKAATKGRTAKATPAIGIFHVEKATGVSASVAESQISSASAGNDPPLFPLPVSAHLQNLVSPSPDCEVPEASTASTLSYPISPSPQSDDHGSQAAIVKSEPQSEPSDILEHVEDFDDYSARINDMTREEWLAWKFQHPEYYGVAPGGNYVDLGHY